VTMTKTVFSPKAPTPIGPYSQAVISSGIIYCSGQLGVDPERRSVSMGIVEEARQCLRNLQAILESAGSSMSEVLKVTIYMTDLSSFKKMNEVYATFFPRDPPARTTVGVASLPMGAKIEIDLIARIP